MKPRPTLDARRSLCLVNRLKVIVLLVFAVISSSAQTLPLSERLADTAINRIWIDERNELGIPPKLASDQGEILEGIEGVWQATANPKYFNHIRRGMESWLEKDGALRSYSVEEYNLDQISPGRSMMMLYRVTADPKYLKVVKMLRSQLSTHPRTKEGGFWHKKIYPNQMRLDGLYMGEPFYAEYSELFNEDNWNDIANQFVWMEKHARDKKTGLLYQAWDESREQKWADKETGLSANFAGRAMGWYAMALVDTLDHFPKDHPRRSEIVAILQREAESLAKVQDKKSGVWWQILNLPQAPKNYLESTCSVMFVYALAKGVRQGNLPRKFLKVVTAGWEGVKTRFMHNNPAGTTDFEGAVSVAGLGANPDLDGSYDYDMGEKVCTDDWKSLGTAIKAAVEMERLENGRIGNGKTVLLDDFFNHEVKPVGSVWHYKWNERSNGGFQFWGNAFQSFGAKLDSLPSAPTAVDLSDASVYIIVDPDTEKETPKPNFIETKHIKAISDWVKGGGVLVMMGNDFGNCEFEHWNNLAQEFGLEFNKDSKNRVVNDQYEQGRVTVPEGNPIFKNARDLYLKEISTLKISGSGQTLLSLNSEPIIAVVKHGKGTVFAIGDPWLYNEYVDGRKMNGQFQNFAAARELSAWLLEKAKVRRK